MLARSALWRCTTWRRCCLSRESFPLLELSNLARMGCQCALQQCNSFLCIGRHVFSLLQGDLLGRFARCGATTAWMVLFAWRISLLICRLHRLRRNAPDLEVNERTSPSSALLRFRRIHRLLRARRRRGDCCRRRILFSYANRFGVTTRTVQQNIEHDSP